MARKTPPKKPEVGAPGYSIGLDGMPTDPQHPWNAPTLAPVKSGLMICHEFNRPLPKWLTLAAVASLRSLHDQAVVKGAGRHAHLKTRDRQNAVHLTRWDMVTELRKRKDELKAFGYKPTWEAAYKNVSEKLKGTFAQGSPGAVKDSYQRVERDSKRDPECFSKYYVALFQNTGLTK